MTRIFTSLAIATVIFLAATFGLGLSLRSGNLSDPTDLATQRLGTVHRLSGIAIGVLVVLVNSIVVTYFIGTSRWCKEVSAAYSLGPELVAGANRLKRRTFPLAVAGMLIAVGVVALGGAADPGAIMPSPQEALHLPQLAGLRWKTIHLAFAGLGICAIAFCFLRQGINIHANHQVISEVLAKVQQIRAAKRDVPSGNRPTRPEAPRS